MMNENLTKALQAYEEKNFKNSFEYFEKARKEMNELEFDKNYSFKFIRTIYQEKIKPLESLDKSSQPWIIYIAKHLKNSDLFFKLTVFKVVELMAKKINVEYSKIAIWLEKLNPESLSEEEKSYELDGKKIKYSSEREKYYTLLSKAYEKSGDMEKAKEISEKALKELKSFNHDSNIWFQRRIAMAHTKNKNLGEALKIYKEIMKKKKDWFILKEVSDIYFMNGTESKGKEYLFDAISAPGEADKKINLFYALYEYFQDKDTNSSQYALKAYFKIKLEQNWHLSEDEKKLAEEKGIELSLDALKKISPKNFINICKQMRWDDATQYSGTIDSVNDNFFFIKEKKSGTRYYCKTKEYPSKKEKPTVGEKVLFNLVESFDNKKNCASQVAINVKRDQ